MGREKEVRLLMNEQSFLLGCEFVVGVPHEILLLDWWRSWAFRTRFSFPRYAYDCSNLATSC